MLKRAWSVVVGFLKNEEGSLKDLVWVIGSGVIMVLIVVAFMVLAPDTARNIWETFIDYATNAFGL